MNWLKIDYRKLIEELLPVLLRKPKFLTLLQSLYRPITDLYKSFNEFVEEILYKLRYNSQVCHLQAVLNHAFDPTLRRIYISDATFEEWSQFLWIESEDRPIMLYKDSYYMLNREGFIGTGNIDFVVNIPRDLQLSENNYIRLNALVRYYKLTSKRYITREYE